MKLHPVKAIQKGFSLVEMLVVIAVIGIIAAIAVPNIGKITDSAKDSTLRRNAQNIASVFASAQAVGWDFSKSSGTGTTITAKGTVINAVITGATIPTSTTGDFATSPFKGAYFGSPGIAPVNTTGTDGVGKYLEYTAATNRLTYIGGTAN